MSEASHAITMSAWLAMRRRSFHRWTIDTTASGTRKTWPGKKRTLDLGERPGRKSRGGDSREFTSGNTTTIYDASGRNRTGHDEPAAMMLGLRTLSFYVRYLTY